MGFHLVEKVYSNVRGTSTKAQAVLAFLAHRADDSGNRKCYPSIPKISEATHYSRGAVFAALNELCEAGLISWSRGGRVPGLGGRSLANEYFFDLPSAPTVCGVPVKEPSESGKQGPQNGLCRVRGTDHARSTEWTMQGSQNGPCRVHAVHPIKTNQPKNQPSSQPPSQPSSPGSAIDGKNGADLLREATAELGRTYAANYSSGASARTDDPAITAERSKRRSLVDEALSLCGVEGLEVKKRFSRAMMAIGEERVRMLVKQFSDEIRDGGHPQIKERAGILLGRFEAMPKSDER